ncbi:MAG: RNA polymerase sigma factor, partial [Planctomycetota bacterium]
MKNPTTAPDLDALLEHGGWVRALARSLVRDPDLADDVEQQTWLTAMQHPPSHGKNLRAWLGTVVRSVAGTHWRADKARQRRESVVGERQVAREVQKASSAQPDSLAERMDTFRQLAGAMSELEEPYGTTLYLRFFEELPVREVARRMEVPEGTAQTRITRGLKMLRARMATSLGPEWRQRCLVFTLPLAKASWLVPAAVIAMTMKTKLFLGAACVALLSLFLWQPWAAGAPESLPDADGLQAAVLEHRKMKPAVVVEEEPVIARAELPTGEDPVGSAAPAGGEQQLVVRVRDAITLEAVADAEILYYDYSEREQEWSDASRWELLDEEELLDRFGTRAVTDAHGVFRTPLPPEKAVMGARVDGK